MGPDVNLRPLLLELGAVLPTPGFYFVMDQMDKLDSVVADWSAIARAHLGAHLPVALSTIIAKK